VGQNLLEESERHRVGPIDRSKLGIKPCLVDRNLDEASRRKISAAVNCSSTNTNTDLGENTK
jgi:hypothetical protein